jgi:hypothetical protein
VARGGLAAALTEAGLDRDAGVHFADELRLGLRGQVRRVLAPRGVKVVQRVQTEYRWAYLLLAVEPRAGALKWRWLERLRVEQLAPVLEEWALGCVVWDGAPGHKAKRLAALATARVPLPPYSPELNPAERVFEEVRRAVEGEVYDSLAAKQAAADRALRRLAADPERVKRLCCWRWIQQALDRLPARAPHATH